MARRQGTSRAPACGFLGIDVGWQVTNAEREGTRIFVAPEVVEPLATAILDVEETPEPSS